MKLTIFRSAIVILLLALLCQETISVRSRLKNRQGLCHAKAVYKKPEAFTENCAPRLVKEWEVHNKDKEIKDCLHKYEYLDKDGNQKDSIDPACTKMNRFDGTYSYENAGLTANNNANEYLNSAKFAGRVVPNKAASELVYDPAPQSGKGFIAATNAPLGNLDDVINDSKLNAGCGTFNQKGKNLNDCVSGNKKDENGKYLKDNTILKFYETLHKTKINYVIMLTNFVEKVDSADCICKVKADKYFPLNKLPDGKYEVFKIKDKDHEKDSQYTVTAKDLSQDKVKEIIGNDKFDQKVKKVDVRKLSLMKDGNVVHKVVHIHFKAWLDFSVPANEDEDSLLSIVKFIRKEIDNNKNAIVHCTGGIGRTGTFIASVLSSNLKKSMKFDLVSFILKLRESRPDFVETDTQVGLIRKNMAKTADLLK